MSTLRVIVDDVVSATPTGIGRYAEELTRQLIATAPRGSRVSGIVSASPEDDYDELLARLPGLGEIYKSPLARRELSAAWQHGFTLLPGSGMVHATSLLAPLSRHDRRSDAGSQTVVTIHDAIAWTRPDLLPSRAANWARGMGKRAERYADAIVVPTHAVAAELEDHLSFGDRVRVIGGAPSSMLSRQPDAAARRDSHGIRGDYVLTMAGWEPRKGLDPLVRSLAEADTHAVPLIIAGARPDAEDDLRAIAQDAGVDPQRIRVLGAVSHEDLSAILAGATVFVQPSLEEGFGLAMLDAFAFSRPVILSDAPALVEVAADAGRIVPREDTTSYPERLGTAIAELLSDDVARTSLGIAGHDRAGAYSWRDSAEKVWQLHADL